KREGLALRPVPGADRDLDPIPGTLRSAQAEARGEEVRGRRERVDHRIGEARLRPPIARNQSHRGPSVGPHDPEPPATRRGFGWSDHRPWCAFDAHDEFSGRPDRISYRALGVTANRPDRSPG